MFGRATTPQRPPKPLNATAVAAAPIGLALCARVLAAWRAAHIFIAFETSPYSAAVSRLLSAARPKSGTRAQRSEGDERTGCAQVGRSA